MAAATFDLPQALGQLIVTGRLQPGEDWGSCAQTGASYADFAKMWRGRSAVPTTDELTAVWKTILAAQRSPRELTVIAADVHALNGVDRNKLFDLVAAAFLRDHPGAARAIGIAVDGDQPANP